jgi:hypothetical protein
LLHGRFVGLPEILGTLMALFIWRFVLQYRPRRTQITAIAAVGYLCARQLFPFTWSPGAEAFIWPPFTASLQGDSLMDFAILIEKSFLYSASIWVLWAGGITLPKSVAVVVGLLGVTEALQTGIPGRVPESTDPFLAFLAGVVFCVARISALNLSAHTAAERGPRHNDLQQNEVAV